MPVVHELALDCPHHCIGQTYQKKRNLGRCLHWIDDVFIGSCVSLTQQNKTKTFALEPNWTTFLHGVDITSTRNNSNDLVSHGHKTAKELSKVHNFYKKKNLAY